MRNDERPAWSVRRLTAVEDQHIEQLALVLQDCVAGGASVSFMLPLSIERARAFWQRVADDAAQGLRAVLVAEAHGAIVGTVQVVFDLPENQPHRADVSKMLVHRAYRRQGLGAALMRAAEGVARQEARSLLVLDTASDDAARLYARLGWRRVGIVPNFALLPEGGLCDTIFFYRELGS
jgi:GNAT superfamily N-acetyltransferase